MLGVTNEEDLLTLQNLDDYYMLSYLKCVVTLAKLLSSWNNEGTFHKQGSDTEIKVVNDD